MDLELKRILLALGIGNENFFDFMEGKVKSYGLAAQEFPWGCFPRLDKENRLVSINMVVPIPVSEETMRVNIHEYMHAFEMYQQLGMVYILDTLKSEEMAKLKEEEYLRLVRQK